MKYMINKNEMTNSQVYTLNEVISYKVFGQYVVKSVQVEAYDFCKDVQVSLVIGCDDTDLFDYCYIFFIGPRGGLSQVNNKGKLVRCNITQIKSIY